MQSLFQDVRYGFRMLLKHPGVSAVAILTLALGIGANAAIFSVVNTVLLRPLPYKDLERLVALWEIVPIHGQWRAAPANFFDWKKQSTSFDGMAAYGASAMTLTGVGEPEQLQGTRVSAGYFETVGVAPSLGRAFAAEEYEVGKGQVAILSHGIWQRRFGSDPNVLNKTINLDGQPYTIVGVMAPGLYLKANQPPRIWSDQNYAWFEIVGVVRDVKSAGLSEAGEPTYYLPAAQAPLGDMVFLVRTSSDPTSIVAAVRQAVWSIDPNQPISSVSTLEQIVSDSVAQPRFNMFLMGMFGVLALLLAVVGIYGLLSHGVTQRKQELGIRMALGANRADVLKLVLRQGMTLALIGEVLGLLGALALSRAMRGLLFGIASVDPSTFVAVVIASTLIAFLACYIPARRATKIDPLVALRYE